MVNRSIKGRALCFWYVQNNKRPYNELAGDVLRKMSNNQYATGIPHNMYVVVNDNHEYNILLNRILLSQNNTLLYSPLGFPINLFSDLIIKKKFKQISQVMLLKEWFTRLIKLKCC